MPYLLARGRSHGWTMRSVADLLPAVPYVMIRDGKRNDSSRATFVAPSPPPAGSQEMI